VVESGDGYDITSISGAVIGSALAPYCSADQNNCSRCVGNGACNIAIAFEPCTVDDCAPYDGENTETGVAFGSFTVKYNKTLASAIKNIASEEIQETIDVLVPKVFGKNAVAPTYAAQRVYDITYANISGWETHSCCQQANYLVANGVGDELTATFTDTMGPGPITSVTVEVAIEHACNLDSMVFSFNGEQIGTWGAAEGPDCDCGNPSLGLASFTLTDPATYHFNGVNSITIMHTAAGSCHEAISANPAWGSGVAFRVTVNR